MSCDWRDGFLFVGNQLALDFVNTRPVMEGQSVELLPDGAALARWLAAAGLISARDSSRLQREWAERAIEQVREFREKLRKAVLQMEAGKGPPARFADELNELLLRVPCVDEVREGESGWERRRRFSPQRPEDAFAPLADAAAELLTSADPARLRKCRCCVLHFYDTSKKGTRAWCSMNLCGNRAKVAAFAKRRRGRLQRETGA